MHWPPGRERGWDTGGTMPLVTEQGMHPRATLIPEMSPWGLACPSCSDSSPCFGVWVNLRINLSVRHLSALHFHCLCPTLAGDLPRNISFSAIIEVLFPLGFLIQFSPSIPSGIQERLAPLLYFSGLFPSVKGRNRAWQWKAISPNPVGECSVVRVLLNKKNPITSI